MQGNTYWREQLPREAQAAYDGMYRHFRMGDYRFTMPMAAGQYIQAAQQAVMQDHPELYAVSPELKAATPTGLFHRAAEMEIISASLYSPAECARIDRELSAIRREVAAAVRGMGEAERERYLAEYVARRARYEINNRMNQNAAAALVHGRAQCSGYAAAFKMLCDEVGIFCIIASGRADFEGAHGPHAWNVVRVDGRTYHVDVTVMSATYARDGDFRCPLYNFSDRRAAGHYIPAGKLPPCTDESYDDADGGIPAGQGTPPAPPAHPSPVPPAPAPAQKRAAPPAGEKKPPAPPRHLPEFLFGRRDKGPVCRENEKPAPVVPGRPAPAPSPAGRGTPPPKRPESPPVCRENGAPHPSPAPAASAGPHISTLYEFRRLLKEAVHTGARRLVFVYTGAPDINALQQKLLREAKLFFAGNTYENGFTPSSFRVGTRGEETTFEIL